MRRAPEGGYDFPNKDNYRRQVYNEFVKWVEPTEARLVLMPSTEGLEIDVAQEKGFRLENMYAVDRNPAIVATLKRRFPAIHTYGVDLNRAVDRIRAEVNHERFRIAPRASPHDKPLKIQAANLDFTSNFGVSLISSVHNFCFKGSGITGFLANPSLLAVTMLRGRESQSDQLWAVCRRDLGGITTAPDRVFNLLQTYESRFTEYDRIRLFGLLGKVIEACTCPVSPLRAGIYRSSNGQTMLWSVFGLGRGPREWWEVQFKGLNPCPPMDIWAKNNPALAALQFLEPKLNYLGKP